jgi:hypothetical protein
MGAKVVAITGSCRRGKTIDAAVAAASAIVLATSVNGCHATALFRRALARARALGEGLA